MLAAVLRARPERKEALESDEPCRLVGPEVRIAERTVADHPNVSVPADPGLERLVHEACAVRPMAEEHDHPRAGALKLQHL
eukprot:2638887-Prymnesium_polylepis.2